MPFSTATTNTEAEALLDQITTALAESSGTVRVIFTGPTAARTYTMPDANATLLFSGGALGTPSGGTLTNCTSLPVSTGISGLGTGVATALAVNVGSAGAPVVLNGAGGTPSSLTLTNATGLPMTTGVTGVLAGANGGTGVANTGKTITLGGNFTHSGAHTLTLTTTGNTSLTLPTSGTVMVDGGSYTALTVTTLNATNTVFLDNVDQSHGLQFVIASDLTATRTLTLTTGDANRALTLTADASISAALTVSQATTLNRQSSTGLPVEFCIVCSDETTAVTAGTGKATFRVPYAFTLTEVRASVNTAPTGAAMLFDINEAGTTVLSTKLMIDASEKTSTTATTAYVISDAAIADDAEVSVDFDQVGSTIAGAGVKIWLKGYR